MNPYHVRVEAPTSSSFRAQSIASRFDYAPGDTTVFEVAAELPTDRTDWQVGIIVGPSGSGKTLLAQEAFGTELVTGFQWTHKAIVDDFPASMTTEAVTLALTAVGLSSVPAWMLPYSALSNGQRFRADLARALASNPGRTVYDEFTSVVDRDVARTASYAVSKAVRRAQGQQFVAVSCHYDITEWLEPDWVFDTLTSELRWGRLRRPKVQLNIYRGGPEAWPVFKKHHYLTNTIHRAARCWLGYVTFADSERERLVGFHSHIPMAGHTGYSQGHRLVVLPDFQGLGIGMAFDNEVSQLYYEETGRRIFEIIASPVLNKARAKSPRWRLSRVASRVTGDKGKLEMSMMKARSRSRLTVSWEFIPQHRGNTEHSAVASPPGRQITIRSPRKRPKRRIKVG